MNGIKRTRFDGLDAVEITASNLTAVLVVEVGPRIASLCCNGGENLLYWDRHGMQRDGWRLYGGHRVWLTRPLADESEDTYLADNQPCRVELGTTSVTAVAPAHPASRLERGMEVTITDRGLRVRNFVTNTGPFIYSGGVWSPTCVKPDGCRLVVPLGEVNTSWDLVKMVIPRVFAGNETTLEDDQAAFVGNDLVVTPRGRTLKRVCGAPQGRVLLDCGGIVFEKHSPYNRLYRYPFDGCNVAVFVGADNFMAELETYGRESDIRPGETLDNIEYWRVYQPA